VAKPKNQESRTPNKYLLSASTSTDAPTYLTLSPENNDKVGVVFIQSLVHIKMVQPEFHIYKQVCYETYASAITLISYNICSAELLIQYKQVNFGSPEER
jgi:hypothetical protein